MTDRIFLQCNQGIKGGRSFHLECKTNYTMEYTGTWQEIWTQKGLMQGTKEDIRIYDGWEKSSTDMCTIANRIIETIDVNNSDSVLEVGCGAGGLARFFDCQYMGIDFSKPLVQKCKEFFGKNAIYAEANELPFPNKKFDKAFSWGVFLYFPNKAYMRQVVSEMRRVTKGDIFIGELPLMSHDTKHMYYSKQEFREMGFEVIDGWSEPYGENRFNALLKGEA